MNPEDYSFEDILQEIEWRKCAPPKDSSPEKLLEGFVYFCTTYWCIRHPERGRILFDMREEQVGIMETWISERYSIVLKARQIGFSTLVAAYSFWLTFFYPDRPVIMLSRTERDAVKLLQKSKYGYRFLPDWMKFRGPAASMTQTKIEFTNASFTESLPSSNDAIRGESVYLVIVDEMAYLQNSKETWAAIEPVADIGGRVLMLSTANGEGNLFHELWLGAKGLWGNGINRFMGVFVDWRAGGRDDAWFEAKCADLPEWQRAQEYPNDPDEAFLKSGRPVFDLSIHDFEIIAPKRGYLKPHPKEPEFEEDGGALRIWEFPEPGHKYVIGADVSFGLEHGDYSSAHVINVNLNQVVAHWHGHIDEDLFGSDILNTLGIFYNHALLGVESNNHGMSTLRALKRVNYLPLYYQHSMGARVVKQSDVLGWRTTQLTKPAAIDELRLALRGGLALYCSETIAELRTYKRDEKGKTSGSPYDDRVMSLAIAVQMLGHVHLREFAPPTEPPPGTFGYMEKVLFGPLGATKSKQTKIARPPIGANYARSR